MSSTKILLVLGFVAVAAYVAAAAPKRGPNPQKNVYYEDNKNCTTRSDMRKPKFTNERGDSCSCVRNNQRRCRGEIVAKCDLAPLTTVQPTPSTASTATTATTPTTTASTPTTTVQTTVAPAP